MGIVFRQGAINTGILFAGILIGFVNEFILLRNFLEQEQVGLIKLLVQVTALFAQFGALGGVNTLLRYFPFLRNRDTNHEGALFGFLAIGAAGFGLVALFLLIFQGSIESRYQERSPLFAEYFYLLYPLILFMINFLLLEAYAKSNYRTVASSFLYEVGLRLMITACVSAYALNWLSIHQFYLLFTAANCLVTVLLAIWLAVQGDWLIKPARSFFTGLRFREMLGFGLFNLLSGFSARLFSSIDSIMIGDRIGLGAVAVYVTGSYLSSVITAPARSLLRVASPLVAEYWKSNDMQAMEKLYRQMTVNSQILTIWLYLLVYAITPALFSLIPPEFAPAVFVFLALGCAAILDSTLYLSTVILGTSHRYYYVLIGNLSTGVFAVLANALLIPRFGIMGASWATFLTMVLSNTFRLIFVYRHFKLSPFSVNTFYAALAGGATWLLLHFGWKNGLATGGVWADSIIGAVLVSVVFLGAVLSLRLSDDIDQRLKELRKKLGF